MLMTRVFDILDNLKITYNKSDILNAKVNQKWLPYSVSDFANNANWVSAALLNLGLQQSDLIAIMSNNRPEWNFVDYGAQQVAMPLVPIYPTIANTELIHILNHSEAKVIFISDALIFQKITAVKDQLNHLKYIFCFDKIEGVVPFADFIATGKNHFEEERIDFIKSSIKEDDLYTILYTSGTTGIPKGVMISHKNIMSNVQACKHFAPFDSSWRALSFLPLNHVYERFLNCLYLFHGISIYYAENFETIGDNCREIQPQIFVAVPRIIERVLEKITMAGEKLTGIKRKIFDHSMMLAERYELNGKNGLVYEMKRKLFDKVVYSKWRAAVGGKLVCIASGGAALNPRLERIFNCANITMLQGYGLTETCVVISVNRYDKSEMMFGTVGPIVNNIEIKIAPEDGEILMRGPSLMLGYYKNEEATKEAIDEQGWFHTGDVGKFIDNKFLKITDRKKEIFKNSAGKYISPILLENKLKENKFIEQCIAIGEGKKFTSALIVPSMVNFKEYCAANKIEWTVKEEMIFHPELKKIIETAIKNVNQSVAPHEQLKRCELINANWTVETGEITPKLSLKRKKIMADNEKIIDKIFAVGS